MDLAFGSRTVLSGGGAQAVIAAANRVGDIDVWALTGPNAFPGRHGQPSGGHRGCDSSASQTTSALVRQRRRLRVKRGFEGR
jgi:hypothetical protein